MKRSLRFTIAVAVVCGAILWQRSLNSQVLPTPKSVTIDALSNGKLADTDYVMVRYQLKELQADFFAPSAKKMMGPLGQVIPLEDANQLMLIDTVANVRKVVKTIKKFEIGEPSGLTYTHKCEYVRAAFTAQKLEEILNNPNVVAANPGGGLPPAAGNGVGPNKPHAVSYDDETNTVIVFGPPDKTNLAKQVIARLDVPSPLGVGRVFALQKADANKIVDLVLDRLRNDAGAPAVKAEVNKNAIAVLGSPNQVEAVRLMIESLSGEQIAGN